MGVRIAALRVLSPGRTITLCQSFCHFDKYIQLTSDSDNMSIFPPSCPSSGGSRDSGGGVGWLKPPKYPSPNYKCITGMLSKVLMVQAPNPLAPRKIYFWICNCFLVFWSWLGTPPYYGSARYWEKGENLCICYHRAKDHVTKQIREDKTSSLLLW